MYIRVKKMAKSSTQRSKEHRERLREQKLLNKTKKKPKSAAERARDYRARQKEIIANIMLSNQSTLEHLPNIVYNKPHFLTGEGPAKSASQSDWSDSESSESSPKPLSGFIDSDLTDLDPASDASDTESKAQEFFNVRTKLADASEPSSLNIAVNDKLLRYMHKLRAKIQKAFPAVNEEDFSVTWKRQNGNICEYMFKSIKRSTEKAKKLQHENVSCNGCGGPITGFRYKCVSCANYDLCVDCEAAGMHPEHMMLRIASPLKLMQAAALVQGWSERLRHHTSSEQPPPPSESSVSIAQFKVVPLVLPIEREYQAKSSVYVHKAKTKQEPAWSRDITEARTAGTEESTEASPKKGRTCNLQASGGPSSKPKKGSNVKSTKKRKAENERSLEVPERRAKETLMNEIDMTTDHTIEIDIVKTELEEPPDSEALELQEQAMAVQSLKVEAPDPLDTSVALLPFYCDTSQPASS